VREVSVVDKGVLARQGEAAWTNSLLLKDGPFVVVASKSGVNLSECSLVQDVTADKITEFEKCTECAKHLGRNIALDSREIDLLIVSDTLFSVDKKLYLHERLGIVASPLLEAPSLRETTKASERRNSGYAIHE
jgi:hypothetical protein